MPANKFLFMPWGLLNQTVIRNRFNSGTSSQNEYGESVSGPGEITSTQAIAMRIMEHRGRLTEHGAEKNEIEGLATFRTFIFNCNYYTNSTLQTLTDILPQDQLVFVDGSVTLKARVTDIHDPTNFNHHLAGTAIWIEPSGY